MTDRIKVLLVDDCPDMTLMFGRVVDAELDIHTVGRLSSADELIAEAVRLDPHVVVLDLTMPGRDPLEALEELRRRVPGCRTIVFSGQRNPRIIDAALRAGAWGMVSKDAEPSAILAAIRMAARGETSLIGAAGRRISA